VIHTDVWYDLRQNTVWQGYQQNGAQVQGRDNPIFSGSPGVFNQTVVHVHEKVPAGTDAGAGGTVPYAVGLFLARQAGVHAWGSRPESWVKEFNYGASMGIAIGAIYKARKATFAGIDHAVIALETARTNN
jgi:N4-gp56 family major capsid protein